MTPRWRLFPKYAAIIIAVVGGLLIASGAIGVWFSYRETESHIAALQVEKAEKAAAQIQGFVLDIEQQLSWTALPRYESGGDALEQRRFEFWKLQRQVLAITDVVWIDPQGREQQRVSRLAMDSSNSGIDLSNDPKFREVADNKCPATARIKGVCVYFGPVYFVKETEPYMTIARPAGPGGGVTAVEVNLKFVWDVVSGIKVGEHGVAYVLDRTGTLIAHPDISLVLKKLDLSGLPQVAALGAASGAAASARGGTVASALGRDLRGQEVFSARVPIPTLQWNVFVESPRDEALAPLYATIARAASVLAAGLVVSVIASFFVARALVRPLHALQVGAERIGAGELDRRIEVKTGDELEGLADRFNAMAGALKESYSDLERKVEVRTAELSEALEQQTAMADILKVMSRSPSDVQPVFDVIAQSARRLCDAVVSGVGRLDGDKVQLVAYHGATPEATEAMLSQFPLPLGRGSNTARAIFERRTVQIPDVLEDSEYAVKDGARRAGYRSGLAVPMMREGGEVFGAIAVCRAEPGLFPERLVRLLETFADQAVIAVENVRLFNETKEALDRQTATSDVLAAISAAQTDATPVFETIARNAHRLSGSVLCNVLLYDGKLLHMVAWEGFSAEQELELRRKYPVAAGDASVLSGRVVQSGRIEHIEDSLVDPLYDRAHAAVIGSRRMLGVPMVREGTVQGVIVLAWRDPGQTPPALVDLLKTFADQAVIAIENVRLFNETREALERQTATAGVLRVISGSVSDSAPVFEKILESCAHLFASSEQGILLSGDDGRIHLGSHRGSARQKLEAMFPSARPPGVGDAAFERRVLHYTDVLADPDVPNGIREVARRLDIGTYSQVFVPMVWEDRAIGSLYVIRQPATGFLPAEIDLLRTFADQAVIAIQNARLFNETREALERQTATADVLQVMSRSVSDVQPVFDKILDSGERLFAGSTGLGIYLVDESAMLQSGGFRGASAETVELVRAFSFPLPRPLAGTSVERAIQERRVVHFPDVLAADEAPEVLRRVASERGSFSIAFAPMLWEDLGIGAIQVSRDVPQPFTDKELALLKTFADQAVIAIQNARLFRETREALDRQTATSDVLRVISESPTDVRPVLEAVAERAGLLCRAERSRVFLRDGQELVAMSDYRAADIAPAVGERIPLTRGSVVGRAFIDGRTMHVEDTAQLSREDFPETYVLRQRHGFRSLLCVPMLREGAAVGVIGVSRRQTAPFSPTEIGLVQTFADQAVIAIENVRLFNETREALERQTAIAGILSVISSSPTDTGPVFEAIVQSCQRLFGGLFVAFARPHDDLLHMVAHADDGTPHGRAGASLPPWPLDRRSAAGTCILEARVVNVADTEAAIPEFPRMRDLALRLGYRSGLFVPLLRDERAIGAIVILRAQPGAFNEREVNLARAFADQAVIAIENVRLFNEIEEKSRQLELANKHKSEFLANMSHELRTPLNAIIGFSEVLAEQMFGDVNEKQLEYLKDIHTSGQHLLTLINDILDLSKIEAGRMELDLATVNLPMLLDNCTTLVRERASRQGLTLALDVDPAVGDWVADVRKIKQIVINLLSNAVKFTPAGGRVTLRARRIDDQVEIAVIDTGVGIAPDQQALVFEEFRQASGDYLRKAEGTGLGLSLAKRFVELHGGSIRVESAPGQGSTFAFVLPPREPVEPAALQA